MVSNRNSIIGWVFAGVWNYWMLHLWISTAHMGKGLEHILGQFTDGTSWKKASVHRRNLVLKSSWKSGEIVWNYVPQRQIQSMILHILLTTGWEPSPKAGILGSRVEGSSWAEAEPCCAATANSASLLSCMSGNKFWRMHTSPFPLPHHNVQPGRGEKVIRIIRKKNYQYNLQEKIAWIRTFGDLGLSIFWRGKTDSSMPLQLVTKCYPYPQQKHQNITYNETEKTPETLRGKWKTFHKWRCLRKVR